MIYWEGTCHWTSLKAASRQRLVQPFFNLHMHTYTHTQVIRCMHAHTHSHTRWIHALARTHTYCVYIHTIICLSAHTPPALIEFWRILLKLNLELNPNLNLNLNPNPKPDPAPDEEHPPPTYTHTRRHPRRCEWETHAQ
jgi:hypothetical protein